MMKMRLAYADPPYPGKAKRYAGRPDFAGEVDHAELIERLQTFDGWALSTGSFALRDVIALCPKNVKIGAWVKPWVRPVGRGHVSESWEPVLYQCARYGGERSLMLDWTMAAPRSLATTNETLLGSKPQVFSLWLFDLLGAEPGDELVDLFPGTGAVGEAWEFYSSQTRLPLWNLAPAQEKDRRRPRRQRAAGKTHVSTLEEAAGDK